MTRKHHDELETTSPETVDSESLAVSENDALRARVAELEASAVKRETDEASLRSGRGVVEFWHCTVCGVKVKQGQRCATHPAAEVNGVGRNPMTGVFGILEVLK